MPDEFGFERIEGQCRCVDCKAGGSTLDWPADARKAHHATHQPDPETAAQAKRTEESVARKERRHAKRVPRRCRNEYCSKEFTPTRTDRVYCSPRCKDHYRYRTRALA